MFGRRITTRAALGFAVLLSIACGTRIAEAATFVSVTDAGTDGHFHYFGRWEHVRHVRDGRFAGASSRSASPGARLTFTFVGTDVRFFGVRGPGGGTGSVTIDGKPYRDVSFYAASKETSVVVLSTPPLPPGRHVVAIATIGAPHDARHRASYVNVSGALFE